MSSSSALSLLDEARKQLIDNEYDHAADAIRAALQVLFERQIAHFREQQQLSNAMSVAVELTQIRPSETSGYQWQGDLLCEESRYAEAAAIYKKGFAKTQVESLRVASETAMARHNIKIDPVQYLPPEIIPLIFKHAPQQRVRCLFVCKGWYQRLFSISSIWRDLTIHYRPSLRAVSMTGFRRVLGTSLDSLTITTRNGVCSAFRLIRQSDCRYIRKLTLKDTTRYKQSTKLLPKFIRGAALLGRHLTELTLQLDTGHDHLLRFILTLCPRLVSLDLKMNAMGADLLQLPIGALEDLPEPTETDLQRLYWSNIWSDEGSANGVFLRTYCPRLQVVSIQDDYKGVGCSAFTEIVTSGCPELQALNIGIPECIAIDLKALPTQRGSKGLRALLINRSCLNSDGIYQKLLSAHQGTLEHFEWAAHDQSEGVHTQAFIPLPNLTVLGLVLALPNSRSITSFLNHCPKLSRLHLTQVSLSDKIMDDILALPQLESIEFIYHYDHDQHHFLESLQHFISSAARQGDNCRLRRLSVFYRGIFPDYILASMGHLHSITVLKLGLVMLSDEGLRGFVENARSSGLLKRLGKLELSLPLPLAGVFEGLGLDLTIFASADRSFRL